MPLKELPELTLSHSAMSVLEAAEERGQLHLANSVDDLVKLATPDGSLGLGEVDASGKYIVGYDVPGEGFVGEAEVFQAKNGVAANYLDAYMRRRDPNCMVVGDGSATDKPTYEARFGKGFGDLREETLEWLRNQPIACFFFRTGLPNEPLNAVAIAPANAGFFALGLAMLQGIVPLEEVRAAGGDYHHEAVLYVAPPFRHTHFEGKQVVVHNRRYEADDFNLHELFSYNLYPGPSAKKGVYGMLLTLGERDDDPWTTAHCSTVKVVTPYENATVIMHEGASGGGKSEMLEHMHRESDGTLLLGKNTVTGDVRKLTLPRGCDLYPVTDDMALCHSALQKDGPKDKLSLIDAENAWFIRVNHITHYGIDPLLERITVSPPGPLLFLNIDAHPNSTALIWEHKMDAPDTPCPNPRVVMPRDYVPNVVSEPVSVDIRSFGVRCPPCTAERPTYGIMGLFHVLPPSLAWLWRLVAPRGHGNPSIVDQGGMQSEGVGSFWPFATGRKVDQANILLDQIMETAKTQFVLIPNQHVGCWSVGFAPQWIAREYLARRGATPFPTSDLKAARCPLLGYHKEKILVEGQIIGKWFMDVSQQPEVGEAAYDEGAKILTEFFHEQLRGFLVDGLDPAGRKIVEACLDNATLEDYESLTVETVAV